MNSFDNLAGLFHLLRSGEREYLLLKEVGSFKKTDKILDVGGGTGAVAIQLAPFVKEITVLDPSKNMLAKIKNPTLKKKVGSAQKIPFANNSFDVVYVVDALHHFTNGHLKHKWEAQMNICTKELLRVLKKNGQLLIVEFNPATFVGKCIAFLENKIIGFGSSFYSPSQINNFFSKEKVEVFHSDKFCYVAKIRKK